MRNYHVAPSVTRKGWWTVRRAGSSKSAHLREVREHAVNIAKNIIGRGYVFVHDEGGRIEYKIPVGITPEEDAAMAAVPTVADCAAQPTGGVSRPEDDGSVTATGPTRPAVDWDQPVFPKTRKEQAEFIETLSGDILMREQDYPAWLALRECAAVLKGSPELSSEHGQRQKANIMARLGGNRR